MFAALPGVPGPFLLAASIPARLQATATTASSAGTASTASSASTLVVAVTVVATLVVVALLVALVAALRAARELRRAGEALRVESAALLGELDGTLAHASAEMARVDDLIGSAESLTNTVGTASQFAYASVASPVIKLLAFGRGTARASRRLSAGPRRQADRNRSRAVRKR